MSSPGSSIPFRLHTVRVGTLNRPKLEAVERALEAYTEGVEVCGHAVDSGVAEQPVGFAEIVRGARTRAHRAYAAGACELGVGIEDGLVVLSELGDEVLNVGAAVVTDGGRDALGFSSLFAYPPACVGRALENREPIGEVFDALWRSEKGEPAPEPSGRSLGNIGMLSLGVLPRSEYGRHAVVCALIQFFHPEMYPLQPFDGEKPAAEVIDKARPRALPRD